MLNTNALLLSAILARTILGSIYNLTLTERPFDGICTDVVHEWDDELGFSHSDGGATWIHTFDKNLLSSENSKVIKIEKEWRTLFRPFKWHNYSPRLRRFFSSLFIPVCVNVPSVLDPGQIKLIAPCRTLCTAAELEYELCKDSGICYDMSLLLPKTFDCSLFPAPKVLDGSCVPPLPLTRGLISKY